MSSTIMNKYTAIGSLETTRYPPTLGVHFKKSFSGNVGMAISICQVREHIKLHSQSEKLKGGEGRRGQYMYLKHTYMIHYGARS